MEIRRRLGLLVMNHLRAREGEHEDWGEPPPFWFREAGETIEPPNHQVSQLFASLPIGP
jgi:hypothetical protein